MKYYTEDRKLVGESSGGIFFKRVEKSKHFMRVLKAYGIQKSVFDKINDADQIWLRETDTNNIYKSKLSDWTEKGIIKDMGAGEQIFLPLKNWSLTATSTIPML